MIGRTLSHYKILEKLGSGGMGDVYVAEDSTLDRKVALKVLPPEMATGERRMRFEREAKAVAALNHPNIVTIHTVEEAEGVHFITMELVQGKTLTELIPKHGLQLNKFFEIAIPLADAVSAAHEQGIIHRDLKPENLMVSQEGRLKILDFGLAKLKQEYMAESPGSELPTEHRTEAGRILGTVAYMSPEQAEGKTVDHRSDIFSIGILLYEMATGERPFTGDSKASIMSSILRDTPTSVTELRTELPRDVAKLIRRCLAKNPEDRLQAAKDLRNELRELKQEVDSGEVFERAVPPLRSGKWLVGVAAALVATAVVTYLLTRGGREASEIQMAPTEAALTQLTSQPGPEYSPSLSPDGEHVVYSSMAAGNWDIYLKRVGGERVINLTEDSPADDRDPAFSPDGEHIAFRSEREGGGIFLMGATGESVRRLTDSGFNPAWSPDGKEIAFATEGPVFGARFSPSQLWAVDVATREQRLITEGDAVQPSWSPHGSRIAYWASMGTGAQRDIWTVAAVGSEAVRVTDDAYVDVNPVWSPDGRYLYFSSDRGGSMNLWRIPMEEQSGESLGPPEAVTTGASASHKHLGFSKDGTRIAYVEEVESWNIGKVAFDPASGAVQGEPISVTRGTRGSAGASVSPDGDWLTFMSRLDIFVMRTDGTGRRQLTDDLHRDLWPFWSPDGREIAFYSNRSGSTDIWIIHPDGSGLRQLTNASGREIGNPAWSPDGMRMSCFDYTRNISYIFDPNKPWEEQTPVALPPLGDEGMWFAALSWSPDGHWLAGSGQFGRDLFGEIVIYSLETEQYRSLYPTGMGQLWLHDSRGLLFFSGALQKVDIDSGKSSEVLSLVPDTILPTDFSPDYKWLYFTRVRVEADIWMLALSETR